jgi:hypothetical protein
MAGKAKSESQIDVGELEEEIGTPTELPPEDKARLRLAYSVLIGTATFFVYSSLWMLLAPADRADEAAALFDFAKSFGAPIITLVLGFYFRGEVSR